MRRARLIFLWWIQWCHCEVEAAKRKNLCLLRSFESKPYLVEFQKSTPLSPRWEEQNSRPTVLQAVLHSPMLGSWAENRENSSFDRKTQKPVQPLLRKYNCVRLLRSPLQPARTCLLEIP